MQEASDSPQIYLITPPAFEPDVFSGVLASVLDQNEVACVRLSLATKDEDKIIRASDAISEMTRSRDVALVIDSHVLLVEKLGLDGVHLKDGAKSVKKSRKELGDDAIIGAFCAGSRHDGMTAGELGADYITLGPAGRSPLGDGSFVDQEVFAWWTQMIEIPVVAEGHLDLDVIRNLAPYVDFFGIGDEIWDDPDPAMRLKTLIQAMR